MGEHLLSECGAHVVAVDIDEEAGEKIQKSNTEKIVLFKGDVSKEEVAKDAVKIAVSKFGKLTGLVNNAHASRQKPLMELTEEDWSLSYGTGFNATLNFMKTAYPELKKNNGAVVNFGSGAALSGQEKQASYAAAKEAIRGFSRVAANEWGKKESNPEQYKQVAGQIPLSHFWDLQKDIAPVVAFLLSADSQYMTGQTLMADGGDIKLR